MKANPVARVHAYSESTLSEGPHLSESTICIISLAWYACLIYIRIELAINYAHGPTEAFSHIEGIYRNRYNGLCTNILVLSMSSWIDVPRISAWTVFRRYSASPGGGSLLTRRRKGASLMSSTYPDRRPTQLGTTENAPLLLLARRWVLSFWMSFPFLQLWSAGFWPGNPES